MATITPLSIIGFQSLSLLDAEPVPLLMAGPIWTIAKSLIRIGILFRTSTTISSISLTVLILPTP